MPRPSPQRQRIQHAVIVYFAVVFAAMIWPVYPFFSRVYPLVAGLPFSLAYLVFWLFLSFLVLLGLYRWESRRGELD